MKARRAARELTLMVFSQLKKGADLSDINDIVLSSVRTLVNDSENKINTSLGSLVAVRDYIEGYEAEHPDNIARPLEAANIPVQVPLTSDMIGYIDKLIDASENALNALEISEFSALQEQEEVKDYINKIVDTYKANQAEIDDQIKKLSKGWDIERLVKIDKSILRIAVTELLHFEDVPISVAIDEAIELAKKYSTDESSSFINGVLRQVVETNKLYQIKK